jgi:hypothetical protein
LVNFDSLADGLYGLPPGQFVAERNAAQKQARSSGNRELAAQLHQLAKPTTVGWLANQLVRQHPEEIGPLLELGAGLREATANLSREKLQELMRLQHQVIAGLITQARAIARDAGQRMSEDAIRGLEDTLRAALADEELGEQLLRARLTGGLEHIGFSAGAASSGAVSSSAAPSSAARQPNRPAPAPKDAGPDPRIAKAEKEIADAKADVEAAAFALEQAAAHLETTAGAAHELSEKVQQLQADLDHASREHSQAQHAADQARSKVERGERTAKQARQRLKAAEAKRAELAS